jgi:hypothetical protein
MSAIQDLQNLAGKIEELKDKLSDEEYKDLLELSHKYYDKEKQKEETRKPRKFVEVIKITPVCHYATSGNCDWDDDSIGEFTRMDNFVNDGCDDFRVACRLSLKQERTLKEVKDGERWSIDIDHDIQMSETTYLQLKEKKHLIFDDRTLIYVSTRIAH